MVWWTPQPQEELHTTGAGCHQDTDVCIGVCRYHFVVCKVLWPAMGGEFKSAAARFDLTAVDGICLSNNGPKFELCRS